MKNTVGYPPSLLMHLENIVGWGSPLFHVRQCIGAIRDNSDSAIEDRFSEGLGNATRHLFASTNKTPISSLLEKAKKPEGHGDDYIFWPLYRLIRDSAYDGTVGLLYVGHAVWCFLEPLPQQYSMEVLAGWLSLTINDISAYAADSFQRADRAEAFRDCAFNLNKLCLPTILSTLATSGSQTGADFQIKTIRDAIDKAMFHSNQELGEMPPKLPTLLDGELLAPAVMVKLAHAIPGREEKASAFRHIAEFWNARHGEGGTSAETATRINALLEEVLMSDPKRLGPTGSLDRARDTQDYASGA